MTSYLQRAEWCKKIVLWALALQLVSLSLGVWVWTPEGREPSVAIWLVKILPLLVFLPSLLRERPQAYIWFCILLLVYFTIAVTDLMSPFATWHHVVDLLLSIILFMAGMLFVRWRGLALRTGNG